MVVNISWGIEPARRHEEAEKPCSALKRRGNARNASLWSGQIDDDGRPRLLGVKTRTSVPLSRISSELSTVNTRALGDSWFWGPFRRSITLSSYFVFITLVPCRGYYRQSEETRTPISTELLSNGVSIEGAEKGIPFWIFECPCRRSWAQNSSCLCSI